MIPAAKTKPKPTARIFWQHTKRYPISFFLVVFGVIAGSSIELYKPVLYKHFFDILSSPQPDMQALLRIVWYVFINIALAWIGWRIATFANVYFQLGVMRQLMTTCFAYLQEHSYRFFSNNFSGSLVRKVNKYSRSFEDITDQIFWSFLPSLVRIGVIAIVLYYSFPLLSYIMIAWTIIYVGFNYKFAVFKLKYDTERTVADTRMTGFIADTITNNMNVKLFTSSKREREGFHKLNMDWYKKSSVSWNLGTLNELIQSLLMIGVEILLLYLSLKLWQKGKLTVGDLVLIQTYVLMLFNRLWDIGRNIRRTFEAFADAEEMTHILLTPHEIQDAPEAGILRVPHGQINFSDVTFNYHEKGAVFRKFNLHIQAGERVAFVGPSGGGKSTVIRLLFRFFDIQKGAILIDGTNIAQVTQESLRKHISLVPQEPILFHRSLLENIRYGRPNASNAEVIHAAKLAHCHEFITKFPEGYSTFVGERGVKLSGGERQRVAIARAILKDAPILVLDEATSSLDSESEMLIADALKTLMKGKTTIVIAHRLSTIMQMDRIVVIENGKIKEQGKHDELIKAKQGLYQKLWHIQAGGFK